MLSIDETPGGDQDVNSQLSYSLPSLDPSPLPQNQITEARGKIVDKPNYV